MRNSNKGYRKVTPVAIQINRWHKSANFIPIRRKRGIQQLQDFHRSIFPEKT
jgi:hypothetical protein